MAHLVSLDKTAHRHVRIDGARVERAGAALNMAPVVLSEFLKLVVHYPIVFTKDKETGRFACVALFGFHQHDNLFVDAGGWDAIYVPLQVARQPFFLGNASSDPADSERYVVCLDTGHEAIVAEGGEALFDAAGNDSAYLESVKQGLADLLNGEEPTRRFGDTLARMKLLTPMQLDIEFANGESAQVAGLYTIDEARLRDLGGEDIAGLHAQDYLAPIYTMLASLGHLYGLIERRNKRLAA